MGRRRSYEGELKGILKGDRDTLTGVVRTCSLEQRDNYMSMLDRPFVVLKAAGSFGIDMVAIRGDVSIPIEVKASKWRKIPFSGSQRLKEQAEGMRLECQRARVVPIYAFRLKGVRGDNWRLFTMEVEGITGRMSIVYRRLPQIPKSKMGNLILDWEKGLPLNKFIEYLNSGYPGVQAAVHPDSASVEGASQPREV